VVAVRVVDRVASNARRVRALVAEIEDRLRPPGGGAHERPLPVFRVEHRFFGGAYGRSTPAADQAVQRAAGAGLRLEPTYTGKTFAALLADAKAGRLAKKRVLYWHTYNGVDLSALIAGGPGPSALPRRLRRYFDNG